MLMIKLKSVCSLLLAVMLMLSFGSAALGAGSPVTFSSPIDIGFINEGMGKIILNPTSNIAYVPHFRDPNGTGAYDVVISSYDMNSNSFIKTNSYVGSSKARDTHNGINIAVDKNGYVHAAYGSHASNLYYKKSNAANDNDLSSGFGAEKMVAAGATYPNIICDPTNANNILIFYRGSLNVKASYIKSTDGGNTWSSPIVYIDHSGTTDSWVYQGVVQGTDGSIHLIWTPFNGTIGNGYETKYIYYAKTTDFGATFRKADGTAYSLPITTGTAEKVVTGGTKNVFAANSMLALDTNNRPVFTYGDWDSGYMKDAFWKMYVMRWNGSSWVKNTISTSSSWIGAQTVITSNGKIHVYTGLKNTINDGTRKPRLFTSTDSGATWSGPETLSDDNTRILMATSDRRFGNDSLVAWADMSGTAKLLNYYAGSSTQNVQEFENLTATVSTGDIRAAFNDANLSGAQGDKFDGNAVNDYITYTVNVPNAGATQIKIKSKNAPVRGKVQMQISVNGSWVNQGSVIDFYSATDSYPAEYDLGSYTFASAGNKSIRFLIVGKNTSSSDYTLGLDYIKLIQ